MFIVPAPFPTTSGIYGTPTNVRVIACPPCACTTNNNLNPITHYSLLAAKESLSNCLLITILGLPLSGIVVVYFVVHGTLEVAMMLLKSMWQYDLTGAVKSSVFYQYSTCTNRLSARHPAVRGPHVILVSPDTCQHHFFLFFAKYFVRRHNLFPTFIRISAVS